MVRKELYKKILVILLIISVLAFGIFYFTNITVNHLDYSDGIELTNSNNSINGDFYYKINDVRFYESIAQTGIVFDEMSYWSNDFYNDFNDDVADSMGILLVDVEASNINAICDFNNVTEKNIFRADFLQIVKANQNHFLTSSSFSPAGSLIYFSKHDECMIHPFAYKLNQGESISYTLGYIVFKENIDSLFLTDGITSDSTFVRLNLHED